MLPVSRVGSAGRRFAGGCWQAPAITCAAGGLGRHSLLALAWSADEHSIVHWNDRQLHPAISTSFQRPLLTSSLQLASIAARNCCRHTADSEIVGRNNLLLNDINVVSRRLSADLER